MFISKLSTELKRGTPLILSWKVRSVFTFGNNRECHNYASWKRMRVSEGVDDFNSECTTSFDWMKKTNNRLLDLTSRMVGAALGVSSTRMLHFFFSLRSRPTISVDPVASGTMKDGGLMSPSQRFTSENRSLLSKFMNRFSGDTPATSVVDVAQGAPPRLLAVRMRSTR